jgi:hypothetical protein
MEIANFISDFENLPKQIQEQVLDYIEFLMSKYKKKEPDFSEYHNKIQTVSQWSEKDVEYLKEIENKYNWKVEEW